MIQLFALLSWLLSLLGLVVVIGGQVWLWSSVVRATRRRDPGCGHCGYAVAELESLTCPECGSDFRQVGITGPFRAPIRPWLFVMAWTVLLAFPAQAITQVVIATAPLYVTAGYTIDLAPHSGVAERVTVTLERTIRMTGRAGLPGVPGVSTVAGGTQDAPTATLTLPVLTVAGGTPLVAELSADDASGQTVTRALGNPPYAAGDIPPWLGALASTTPAAELTADAQELADLLNAWSTTGTFTTTRFGFTGGRGVGPTAPAPAPWLLPTVFAGWLALYATGIVLYFRVRR